MALFTEPFAWLKPIGDAIGQASEAVRPFNDWNALGSVGWKPGGLLGELTYNPPDRERIAQRTNTTNPMPRPQNNSGGVDNFLAALKGEYNTPQSSIYGQEGIPPMLMEPEPVDEVALEYAARAEKIQALMDQLQMGTDNQALADEAFAGSLAAIEKARGSAQNNFKESDAAIQGLTQGHVNEIKTVDRQAVTDNAQQFSGELNQTYDGATKALAADRNKDLSARAEMLSRLGIQEAGLGDTGNEQTQAIDRKSVV